MADRNEQVMEMVARELEKDPRTASDKLYRLAKQVDPAIGELSLRQFHARYPLQLKRAQSRGKKRGKRKRRTAAPQPAAQSAKKVAAPATRDRIRDAFLQFASDFSQAETRSEIVQVLSSVDTYVDRVEKLVKQR